MVSSSKHKPSIPTITSLKGLWSATELEGTGSRCLLIGSGRCGKTYLLNHIWMCSILGKMRGALMCKTLNNGRYEAMRDVLACFYDFEGDVVDTLVAIQRRTKNKYDFVVLVDDQGATIKKNMTFKNLLALHRNSNIHTVVSAQHYAYVDKDSRSLFDYIFFGAFNTDEGIECIMKTFLGSFFPGTMTEKCAEYRELTENNYFLVLNNLTGSLGRFKAP